MHTTTIKMHHKTRSMVTSCLESAVSTSQGEDVAGVESSVGNCADTVEKLVETFDMHELKYPTTSTTTDNRYSPILL